MQVTEWAVTTWENRASATYVAIDRAINDTVIDAYGRKSGTFGYMDPAPRRPVKAEAGETTAYVMYDDDTSGAVPIIRISEVTEETEETEA